MSALPEGLESFPQMDREWKSWQAVCAELRRLKLDINEHNPLARSIERWGEELAALRSSQAPALCAKVLMEKRAAYPNV